MSTTSSSSQSSAWRRGLPVSTVTWLAKGAPPYSSVFLDGTSESPGSLFIFRFAGY